MARSRERQETSNRETQQNPLEAQGSTDAELQDQQYRQSEPDQQNAQGQANSPQGQGQPYGGGSQNPQRQQDQGKLRQGQSGQGASQAMRPTRSGTLV